MVPVQVSMPGLAGEHVSLARLQRAVKVSSQVAPPDTQLYDALYKPSHTLTLSFEHVTSNVEQLRSVPLVRQSVSPVESVPHVKPPSVQSKPRRLPFTLQ